jgi:hypothetical protein
MNQTFKQLGEKLIEEIVKTIEKNVITDDDVNRLKNEYDNIVIKFKAKVPNLTSDVPIVYKMDEFLLLSAKKQANNAQAKAEANAAKAKAENNAAKAKAENNAAKAKAENNAAKAKAAANAQEKAEAEEAERLAAEAKAKAKAKAEEAERLAAEANAARAKAENNAAKAAANAQAKAEAEEAERLAAQARANAARAKAEANAAKDKALANATRAASARSRVTQLQKIKINNSSNINKKIKLATAANKNAESKLANAQKELKNRKNAFAAAISEWKKENNETLTKFETKFLELKTVKFPELNEKYIRFNKMGTDKINSQLVFSRKLSPAIGGIVKMQKLDNPILKKFEARLDKVTTLKGLEKFETNMKKLEDIVSLSTDTTRAQFNKKLVELKEFNEALNKNNTPDPNPNTNVRNKVYKSFINQISGKQANLSVAIVSKSKTSKAVNKAGKNKNSLASLKATINNAINLSEKALKGGDDQKAEEASQTAFKALKSYTNNKNKIQEEQEEFNPATNTWIAPQMPPVMKLRPPVIKSAKLVQGGRGRGVNIQRRQTVIVSGKR